MKSSLLIELTCAGSLFHLGRCQPSQIIGLLFNETELTIDRHR